MRKYYLVLILVILLSFSFASMSKLYIGNEDGQVIVGIESIAKNIDGAAGLEIRTYFRKNGINVNGQEYGAAPAKTKYRFILAGKNRENNGLIRYERYTTYTKDLYANSHTVERKSSISLGAGQGGYLLYH